MKRILFLTVMILGFILASRSQTYLISSGGTVNACTGDFFDSGGNGGNYGNNENFTMTFHSTNPLNTHIKVSFNSFDIDASDMLYVYDGSNTSAPLIGAYNNVNPLSGGSNAVQASIYNTSGNLTFNFVSNGSVTNSGWFASLVCIPQCQKVVAMIDTTKMIPLPNDSNYVDICFGDSIRFAADAGPLAFPQDNILYDQDSSTTQYLWDFGDGATAAGRIVWHKFTAVQGYDVYLRVIDIRGCDNTNLCNLRVRISANPFGEIHPLANLCSSADSIEITTGYSGTSNIVINPIDFYHSASQSFDSTMFVPDGPDCPVQCYNTEVTFDVFAPGATISAASDVLSICVNMEHSFTGDLGFTIICPNGQQVVLDPNTHSGGAYMGEPYGGSNHDYYDSDTNPCQAAYNPAGVGWTYCWSETYSQQGTLDALSYGSTSPIDSTNQITHTDYITPNNSLAGLIGCPLNGTWNIEICDDYGIDNGYIFNWTLNLNPALLPTGWGYTVPIDSIGWSGSFIEQQLDSSIIVYPDSGGIFTYTITIYDAFGCSYDTTFQITVINSPAVNLGNDTTVCGGTILLDAGNPNADAYLWSTGATSQQIQVNTTGTYIVEVTNTDSTSSLQCKDSDTINVIVNNSINLTINPATLTICSGQPATLIASGATTYVWNTGNTDSSIIVSPTATTTYTVTGTNSGCAGTASCVVTVNPSPNIQIITTNASCGMNNGSAIASGGMSYIWNDGQTTDTATGLASGNYTVTVTGINGCSASTDVTIGQTPGPSASFSANPKQTNAYVYITFHDNSTGDIISWQWDFGDGSTATDQNCIHQYGDTGTYTVTLIVTEANGCIDSVSDIIKIRDIFTLYIPNTFTPDGDGINDFFFPKGVNVDPDNYEMDIFDCWGNLMFRTTTWVSTHGEPWNGTKNNSGTFKNVVMGVYVYRILAKEIQGHKHEYLGRVTLIR